MTTATLVRLHHGAATRARETYETDPKVETLYRGDLAGAIAAARALPAAERLNVSLRTGEAYYGPDDFDTMTPDNLPMRDLDMMNGAGIVRVEKAALERMRGDRRMITPMALVTEHIDVITAILQHKKLTGDVEEVDGKRLIRITAADIEAA